MAISQWKSIYGDYVGFIKTQAFERMVGQYNEEDKFRILINKDSDSESFLTMQSFFNDVWTERARLISLFDAAENDEAREAITIDFSIIGAGP